MTLFGEEIQVNAEIHSLEGFSGHADQDGLLTWISSFRQQPKQTFLVHGEDDSKKDFAKLVKDKLGYDPVVVLGNSEFELDMESSTLLNFDEANKKAVEYDEIQAVRSKISDIHNDMEHILYNADLAMAEDIDEDKIIKINNIIQELEKATINLGTVVNERKYDKVIDTSGIPRETE